MGEYIVRRLLAAIIVLLLVSLGTFSLIRIIPGDIVSAMLAESGGLNPQDTAKLRASLGLDRPFVTQYILWVGGVVRGDLGRSLWTRGDVLSLIREALPNTLELSALALVIGVAVGLPIGIVSATRQNTWQDYSGRMVSIAGLSLPDFWLGTVFILIASLGFKYGPPLGFHSLLQEPLVNLQQFIWPAIILGFRLSAVLMRMTRSSLLGVLREDYIRTARAKGLRERAVIYAHALKNAMIPIITILGNQIPFIIGGAIIMETIFGIPGMGRLTVDAIRVRDYTVVQGNTLLIASGVVIINLLVDITYGWLDPRIRLR